MRQLLVRALRDRAPAVRMTYGVYVKTVVRGLQVKPKTPIEDFRLLHVRHDKVERIDRVYAKLARTRYRADVASDPGHPALLFVRSPARSVGILGVMNPCIDTACSRNWQLFSFRADRRLDFAGGLAGRSPLRRHHRASSTAAACAQGQHRMACP